VARFLLSARQEKFMKHFVTLSLTASLFTLAASAYADCTAETVIDPRTGAATVKTVCTNGDSVFSPGGSGGNCHTVIIPGKGGVLLCE
jgi:hypothetical protein